ncbi:hypothetical protein D3C72_2515310 [compost metagenome]
MTITRTQPYTRLEADRIMREAMGNRGVGWFKRNLIYLAVRIGGHWGWRDSQESVVTPEAEKYITE